MLVRLSSRKEETGGEGAVVPLEVKLLNILPMSFDFYKKQIVCTNPPCECAQERPSTYKRLTQGRGADSLASPLSQLPPVESESEKLKERAHKRAMITIIYQGCKKYDDFRR